MAQKSLYSPEMEQLALLPSEADLGVDVDNGPANAITAESDDLLQITRDMFCHTGTDQELLDRVVTAIEILCDRLNMPTDHVA